MIKVGSYATLAAARAARTPGYSIYESCAPKGAHKVPGELAVYQQGEDGVYRIPAVED